MLIPYAVDVPLDRKPIVNWLLIISIMAVFGLQMLSLLAADQYDAWHPGDGQQPAREFRPQEPPVWVLTGWDLRGLIGHMWLHGGLVHLAGNMLFLWVFGNAVCSKVGNFLYFPLYLAFGLFAAAAHLIFDGNPAVGASGAINGVVGMYLVFFPLNDISCFWMMYLWYHGTFSVSGFWMILFWLFFDILGAVLGVAGTAYYAHLGGFALGVALGFLLLALKVVKMNEDERSIVCIIREHSRNRLEDRLAEEARRAVLKAKQQEEERVRAQRVAALKKQAVAVKQSLPQAPAATDNRPQFIRFSCSCGQRIKVPSSYAGRDGMCPGCKRRLTIPLA